MLNIVREPLPSDYSVAVGLVSEEIKNDGGVWVAVMRPEIAAHNDFDQFKLLNAMARIAILARVSLEGGGVASAVNLVQSARAYRYGMQMGSRIVSLLYSDQINDGNILFGYAKLFEANGCSSDVESEQAATLLESLGELGLDRIDELSRIEVRQWSEDVGLKEFETQRLFELGVGGVLATAHAMYDAQIQAISRVIVKSHKWSQAIDSLTTGEQGDYLL